MSWRRLWQAVSKLRGRMWASLKRQIFWSWQWDIFRSWIRPVPATLWRTSPSSELATVPAPMKLPTSWYQCPEWMWGWGRGWWLIWWLDCSSLHSHSLSRVCCSRGCWACWGVTSTQAPLSCSHQPNHLLISKSSLHCPQHLNKALTYSSLFLSNPLHWD